MGAVPSAGVLADEENALVLAVSVQGVQTLAARLRTWFGGGVPTYSEQRRDTRDGCRAGVSLSVRPLAAHSFEHVSQVRRHPTW